MLDSGETFFKTELERVDVETTRGRIFICVQPFYERAVSDLDRSMNRSLWV
jgi:hypothetical protein